MRIAHIEEMEGEAVRQTRVETQIHQRQCERCQRWFWAWDWSRWKCFVCDPLPPEQLRRVLNAIRGAAHSSDTGRVEPALLAR